MKSRAHQADVCVVGGGMAGLSAAIAAARHGARTILIQDRPVFGGNASSECRVHIQGADRHNALKNLRETGILEELRLENLARNPNKNFSVWDTILYERVMLQANLAALLNCPVHAARAEGGRLLSVTGRQLTTETEHTVEAAVFMDASGDGVLPLAGAEFRIGREARDEFHEPAAPETADSKTMGMTCLFQARAYPTAQPFEPLPWAYRFERCEDLPYGVGGHKHFEMGYWWVELGGEEDSIHDAESLKHELLRIAFGVWDHVKNRCPASRGPAATWALEWVQFLPAKRESRRYVGEHVMTQNDIEAEGRFPDRVAYGGWTMDDHHPAGFWCTRHGARATIHHRTPSPYGIAYRALYSRSVANLMAVGRCASATHMAMSSMRVMGTGCSMGQAAGTAAAMAAAAGALPRDLAGRIGDLQQALLRDDAYIPWLPQTFGPLTAEARLAASRGNPEPLRDGTNRPVGDDPHAWPCRTGDSAWYEFAGPRQVRHVTVIADSGLDKNVIMSYHGYGSGERTAVPPEMAKAFRLDGLAQGQWRTLHQVRGNHQRLVRLAVGAALEGVRFTLDETWGAAETRLYAFYVE
jgi:hypothetical protein